MNIQAQGLPVYILAGGRSSRFGSDKARALLSGTPLVLALAETMRPVARSMTVVGAGAGQYADLGLATIGDLNPGEGPLGGLHTALQDLPEDGWLALVACDWAGARAEWLSDLQQAITREAQCVLYEHARLEPLFALYHSRIVTSVEAQRAAGRWAMMDLVRSVPHRTLPAPPGWTSAANINRLEDLQTFRGMET